LEFEKKEEEEMGDAFAQAEANETSKSKSPVSSLNVTKAEMS